MSIYRVDVVNGEPVVKDFMSGRRVRDKDLSRMVLFAAGELDQGGVPGVIRELPDSRQKRVLAACFSAG